MKLSIKKTVPMAMAAQRLLSERISISVANNMSFSFINSDMSGYSVKLNTGEATIYAKDTLGFVAGVGILLIHFSKISNGIIKDLNINVLPQYKTRTHYMPAHFGNSFEASWPLEMKKYLEDAALSGANGYGDWFDPNDMPDPYNPRVFCSKSMFIWDKKKENFRTSKNLGMENLLLITHNVAFTDQLRPEWEAVHSHRLRVQGQVLCPSIPQARAVCMQNHKNLFEDLIASDIKIDRLALCPYDDGGCACDKCQPYYPTFLSMVKEILNLAQKYYPDIVLDIVGWWTSDIEMTQIKAFINELEPGVFNRFQFNPPYHEGHEIPVGLRDFIGDMPLSTFVNIGYSDERFDVYNKFGVHSAAHRLNSLISTFKELNCDGINTYNEGFNDHLNVYLSSKLLTNPSANIRELLSDYSSWMLGLSDTHLETMTDILEEMQFPFFDKADEWLEKLKGLRAFVKTPPRQPWIFEHVFYKALLMSLDNKIGNGQNWNSPEDIEPLQPLIDRRLEETEILWRDVYGMGAVAHVFVPERMYPEWYKKYDQIKGITKGHIVPGSVLSKNA